MLTAERLQNLTYGRTDLINSLRQTHRNRTTSRAAALAVTRSLPPGRGLRQQHRHLWDRGDASAHFHLLPRYDTCPFSIRSLQNALVCPLTDTNPHTVHRCDVDRRADIRLSDMEITFAEAFVSKTKKCR